VESFPVPREESPGEEALPTREAPPTLPPSAAGAISSDTFAYLQAQVQQFDRWRRHQEELTSELVAQNKLLRRQLEERENELQRLQPLAGAAEARTRELEAQLRQAQEEARRQSEQQEGKLRAEAERTRELETKLTSQPSRLAEELEEKVEQLNQLLRARDNELDTVRKNATMETEQVREEARRALAQVRDLEAALRSASSRILEKEAEGASQKALIESLRAQAQDGRATAEPPPAAAPAPLSAPPPDAAVTISPQSHTQFYQQAVTPLTVLAASVDLLLMNPRLDAELREIAIELKQQSTKLVDLIKEYTGPPAGKSPTR
jgi:DNA repair exonuclease SbcCD ATPase subunit